MRLTKKQQRETIKKAEQELRSNYRLKKVEDEIRVDAQAKKQREKARAIVNRIKFD